ncbi:putative transposable element [Trichonephila clavipes]|nr:putative transposable element [Trichonephila clavipes]
MITNFFIPELNNHDVQELWFQQDGATCHTARATIDLLKDTFGDRLISRFGPVNWSPRSCDLTPLDYFLWGYVKSLVYMDKPQTLDHLEDNIRRVIADIGHKCCKKSSKIGRPDWTTCVPAVACYWARTRDKASHDPIPIPLGRRGHIEAQSPPVSMVWEFGMKFQLSGSSLIPSNVGRMDGGERISPTVRGSDSEQDKIDSAFHLYSREINEYQARLGTKEWEFLRQNDHLGRHGPVGASPVSVGNNEEPDISFILISLY